MNFKIIIFAAVISTGLAASPELRAVDQPARVDFKKSIQPVLVEYCYDCHGDGSKKGGVAFDELNPDHDFAGERVMWLKAFKMLGSGLMPPATKAQPSLEQKQLITQWIKTSVFAIDPKKPDPGRVTIRRLNRVEYRNTVRDLTGVDYDTQREFPPDDTGHGFDNISDVLTLPPMLLEKYLVAAEKIIGQAVPASDVPVA